MSKPCQYEVKRLPCGAPAFGHIVNHRNETRYYCDEHYYKVIAEVFARYHGNSSNEMNNTTEWHNLAKIYIDKNKLRE